MCKERGLKLAKGTKKVKYQIALKDWKEVCLLQAFTQEKEVDGLEKGEKNKAAEAPVPVQDEPGGDKSRAISRAGSLSSSHCLPQSEMEDRQAGKAQNLQLAHLALLEKKMAAEEKKATMHVY
ncbi:hypothetical protein NDU88_002931 [Pleurodeles waltl]|uniref:Uncharacterized protein n=1 Tax=Pleurodeles waltl TaxID=8319 RepID=A0AAV7NIF9_PLEWA|nr:hypothetical protein NDU88_002931 [Pleurodeles waltl]